MMRPKEERQNKVLGEQLKEKIGDRLEGSRKTSHLTAAVFAISFLALTVAASVHNEFRRTALVWALIQWIVHFVWTIIAAVGWRTLSEEEFENLSEEERIHRLHLQTAWFRFWKGGLLLLFSTQVLLLALGMLKYLVTTIWADRAALSIYGLTYMVSLWQRRRICQVRIEGWSPDTRWGRLMLRLAVIGPAATASTCSALTVALARLRIVPESVAAGFFGTLGIAMASLVVPPIIYDFLAAWVHWQIYKSGGEEIHVRGE